MNKKIKAIPQTLRHSLCVLNGKKEIIEKGTTGFMEGRERNKKMVKNTTAYDMQNI